MKKYFKILLVVFAVCFCVVSVNADDEFDEYVKKLNSLFKNNSITINYNDDLTAQVLSDYVNHYLRHNGIYLANSTLSYDSDLTTLKLTIEGWEGDTKEYNLNVIHNKNINMEMFNYFDVLDILKIKADSPGEDNVDEYIISYLNNYDFCYPYDEGDGCIEYNFNYVSNNLFMYAKDNDKNNIQLLNAPFEFVGYDSNVSEIFEYKIGEEKTLYADSYLDFANNASLGNGFVIVGNIISEDGYGDVAYTNNDGKVEIHKVKFNLCTDYTTDFTDFFGIEKGDIAKIYTDGKVSEWFSPNIRKSISEIKDVAIDCNSDGYCYYVYNNYAEGHTEVHKVNYELVIDDASNYFISQVALSKDVYFGENTSWWELTYTIGDYGNEKHAECYEESSSCDVAILNPDGKLEMRNVIINVKEGKSPLAQSLFPDNVVRVNTIYDDNNDNGFSLTEEATRAYLQMVSKGRADVNDVSKDNVFVMFDNLEIQEFDVEYRKSNSSILSKVNNVNDKLLNSLKSTNYAIAADDLEFINLFYYNLIGYGNFDTISFNNTLKNIINNNHINYYYVLHGGMANKYINSIGGNLVLYYDGVAYKLFDKHLYQNLNHVIYIPDNTAETKEAYIAAAQKRIDDYLGKNSGVIIEYNGDFDYKEAENYSFGFDSLNIDSKTFDGNEYVIRYGHRSEYVLIHKDSSRMKSSTFMASDILNNINISSETANYPTNTFVDSNIINDGVEEHKEFLDKLEFESGYVIDLSLYSKNLGTVDKFDGGKFKVKLSLDGFKYYGLDLYAFYIDEEGNVEKYKVTMDGDYATFEPTHFSTYVIADINGKVGEEPPIEELSLTTKSYYNKIRLEYNEIKDATKYVIYTCNSKGASCKKLATTTSTIYDHKSLGIGKTYYYKVLAYDGSIKIMTSDLVKGSTTLGKPVLIATTDRYKEVKLSWGSISGASRYYVYRCNSKGSDCTKLGYTKKTSYTYTGGSEGYKYIYKVRAYRSGYYGPTSDGVEGMKLKDGISFSLTKPTYRTIQISINHLSTAKKYYIYRATSKNGKYSKIATLDATGETIVYKDTSVSFNKKYYYKIIASNGINNTAATSYKYIVSNALYKPVVTASNNRYQNTIINWNKIAGATKYYVYRCNSAGSKCEKIASTTKTSYTYTGGSEGVTYQYKVKPYVGSVAGPTSAGVDGIKLKDGISYSLSSDSYRSIVISINHLSTAKKYYIYRATSKNGKYSLVTSIDAAGEKIIYNDTGLTFNKKYYYKIKVSNGVNTSAYSSIKYYTAASLAKPNVEVNVSDKKVTFNMPKVYGSTGVEIYYSTDGKTYKLLKRTTSTSYTRDLAVGKHYFKVRAYKLYSSKYYYSSYTTLETIEIVDTPEVTPSV